MVVNEERINQIIKEEYMKYEPEFSKFWKNGVYSQEHSIIFYPQFVSISLNMERPFIDVNFLALVENVKKRLKEELNLSLLGFFFQTNFYVMDFRR